MGDQGQSDRAAWEGEMFRLLAENVRDYAIFIVDPERCVLSWSQGAERLLGFTEAEIVGQRSDRFFTPEDVRAGVPQRELEQALATGRGDDDRWHMRKDGTRFWASGVVTPLKDEAGRLRWFAKIMRDRTEMKRAADEAHDRDRQLRLLTDQAPVLIAHCDADRRFRFVNKPYAARFGLAPEQVVGRHIRDVLGGPGYAAVERHVGAALTGERVEFESEIPYAGAGTQVVRCAYDPEFDDAGRVVGFVAALVNVTESRRSREALRESEERLRTLSDNLPRGAVYQVLGDPDGRRQFTYISAGVERLFGVTPAEAMADATSLYGLVHEDDRPRVAAAEEVALRGLTAFDCEFRSWTRDGGVVWVHARSAPRRLPTGQTVWEGILTDVTARKRAEEELAASRGRLQALFDNTLDAVLLADDQGRYVDANPAACKLLGLARDDLLRRTVFDLTPPQDAAAGRAAWDAFLRDGQQAGEYAVRRPDGTRAVVEYRAVAHVQPGLHLSVLRDVTERERLLREVRAERERLADVFQQAPSFMCVLRGPGHVFERANDRYLQLVGHRDIVGRPIREALPEIAGQGFLELLDAVYRTGETYTGADVRVLVTRQPGEPPEERFVDFVYQPTRDPDGAVTGVLVQGVDLTDRHRAEAEVARLHAESDRLRRLYETALSNSPDYNFTFDLGGRFTYANEALLALWGRRADEALGRTPLELGYPPDLAGRLVRQVRQVADTRQPVRDDTPFTTAAGRREFEYTLVPVVGAGGAVEAVVGSAHDITDRKALEDRLRDQAERLTSLVDHTPLAVVEWDREFHITRWSGEAERVFGWTAAEMVGRRIEAAGLVYEEDEGKVRETMGRLLDGTNRYVVSANRNRTKGGGVIHCEWYNSILSDGAGRMEAVLSLVLDVTDRTRAEAELRAADRRKDEFLAMLAHELRNPLAPIRTAAQVIRLVGASDPNVLRSTALIERQVQAMTRLVDDLLDVSRITTGKIKLQTGPVELAAVVARAVETARPLIDARRHELVVTLPPGAVWLDADATRLAQVVSNLLTNAAKYTDEGGHIRLTAGREGGAAVVRVRDTGVGIPAGMLPRVFDLFTQVDGSLARSDGGLGIGLTLVKRLVEMHGGTVEAASEGPGRGSEFVVRLPVARTPEAPDAGGADRPAPGRPPPRRVLVVDDNVDAAESLAMLLRVVGHDVRTAPDGPTALDAAGAFRPEVVLLDIGLPRMDGYEVARRLRGQAGTADALLVALTGYGQEEDRRRSHEAGFDAHLTKPADPTALQDLLARTRPPA